MLLATARASRTNFECGPSEGIPRGVWAAALVGAMFLIVACASDTCGGRTLVALLVF